MLAGPRVADVKLARDTVRPEEAAEAVSKPLLSLSKGANGRGRPCFETLPLLSTNGALWHELVSHRIKSVGSAPGTGCRRDWDIGAPVRTPLPIVQGLRRR